MRTNYIQVLPSAELARFNLKGLTPEMFCVNIADMVNIRGLYSGQVENERQIPVAKWDLNYEEYLLMKNTPASNLNHKQIVNLLASIPGYIEESDNQYIEFEERIVPHEKEGLTIYSGYRLTIMTEEIEDDITTHAYYYLDTCTQEGWQDIPPAAEDYEIIRTALTHKLKSIRDAGVEITQVNDETDYTTASD